MTCRAKVAEEILLKSENGPYFPLLGCTGLFIHCPSVEHLSCFQFGPSIFRPGGLSEA